MHSALALLQGRPSSYLGELWTPPSTLSHVPSAGDDTHLLLDIYADFDGPS